MVHKANSSTFHPAAEHLQKIGRYLFAEKTDDRLVAILGAAYLEKYITDVIVTHMPGLNSDLRSKLFGKYGTLAELQIKIDMLRALGACHKIMQDQCITIARVRNRFAHDLDIDSFDHPDIVKLCASLPDTMIKSMHGVRKSKKLEGTNRQKFTSSLVLVCAVLSNTLNPNNHGGHFPSPAK